MNESLLSKPFLVTPLLAALSHELGSPLAVIKGATTTLIDYRQRLPDERIDGFLRSIDAQADQLNGLLDDLVLLAKAQAGTLRLQPEPIALRDLIEQAIEQLPPNQHDNFLIEGRDPEVVADAPYLRHAFSLLLQHLHEGAAAQTIIQLETTTTAQLLLIGNIDHEVADPLTQVDQLLGSSDPGRGRQAAQLLRLSLSRALIELHGGAWKMENQSGEGPALCLTLPLAHQDGDDD